MRARLLVVLAFGLASCGGRFKLGPPGLFPVTTVWVAPAGDVLEPPLATDGVRVFAATRSGVLALDVTGTPAWRLADRSGRLAAAPGLVVLRQADGTLVALDPATGSVRWSTPTGIPGDLAPVVDDDRILVAGEGLAAVEASSGRILWSAPAPPTVSTLPVARGPWVLAGEADGTLRCRDRATGLSLWTHATGERLVAPPVVDDRQRILLGTTTRRFLALGLERKGDRLWRWTVGADVQGPAAVLRDRVLFASYEAVLYALNRGNGHLAWRVSLPSRPLSGPLLVGDSVLVACYESEIVGFDGRTGRRLGGLRTPAEIHTVPLVVGDRVYVGLRDRTIAAFQLDLTPARPVETPRPDTDRPGRRGRRGREPGSP
ncbi:MAG: PQQ-binding-like beta-propeller repeat protein [Acidobacteria bacterium]|nr:PQQ-binding-like beta-propeller repeat protein [Acidobacteriota bacterium]